MSSCRVLRPPGGGSSNIFGFADDEPKPVKKVEKAPPSDVTTVTQNAANATVNGETTPGLSILLIFLVEERIIHDLFFLLKITTSVFQRPLLIVFSIVVVY